MAIARMAKVMIACHRSEVSDLLEALQSEGICQILGAEEAFVSRELDQAPDRGTRPKDTEARLGRIERGITFLKQYAAAPKGLAAVLSPRPIVDENAYRSVVCDDSVMGIVERAEQIEAEIDRTRGRIESLQTSLESLSPWDALKTPVEEASQLSKATCWMGLIPVQQVDKAMEKLAEIGAAVEIVGSAGAKEAAVVVGLNENADDIGKALRAVEFEAANFEGMSGTVRELITQRRNELERAQRRSTEQRADAAKIAGSLLKVQIIHDHYRNLLSREQTKDLAPATESTVLLEGWVRHKDYPRLEEIVRGFGAAGLAAIEPAEGEEVPVDIDNRRLIKPFEVVTRLYGMPHYLNIDPTIFLAPFFGMFFGICLGDAGYALVVIVAAAWLARKLQGDKRLVLVLGLCSIFAVVFGALTGSWFGDAVTQFAPGLDPLRRKLMWFDPFEQPMILLGLSVVLGYIQIMAGLLIALAHNLRKRDFIAAICDQMTWLVMLNCIVLFGLGKMNVIPAGVGSVCGKIVPIPAVTIFLFSSREGGWGARLGMGAYNVFSAIFYMGDVLSYLRLMGLCMVGAGLGMAMNLMAKMALDIPFAGIAVAIIVFAVGHGFNLVLAVLGAFVHTMRLQFVEFFPKFLIGGGRTFEPLTKQYKHIYIQNSGK